MIMLRIPKIGNLVRYLSTDITKKNEKNEVFKPYEVVFSSKKKKGIITFTVWSCQFGAEKGSNMITVLFHLWKYL